MVVTVSPITIDPDGLPWPGRGMFGLTMCPDGTFAFTTRCCLYRGTLSPDGSTATLSLIAGAEGEAGYRDGLGEHARFHALRGVAAMRDGSLVVAEHWNDRIRAVSTGGVVSTLAGSGELESEDGVGTEASFYCPYDLAVRRDGTVLVTEQGCHAIRAIAPGAAAVTTPAGAAKDAGFADGDASTARFHGPRGMAVLPGGGVLVCDTFNRRLRVLSADGGTVRTLAGSGVDATTDGVGAAAAFSSPAAIAVGRGGHAIVDDYSVDQDTSGLRLVDCRTGGVTTLTDAAGEPLEFPGEIQTTIVGAGRVIVGTKEVDRLRLVTGVPGLGPGLFAWTAPGLKSEQWWRPNRGCHLGLSRSGGEAVRTVLLVATRLMLQQQGGSVPGLPLEVWHFVLRMLETYELGALGE